MAPQKRKQPHDGRSEASVADVAYDAPVRRSTRQHPDVGAAPEHHQSRSGRRRQNAVEKSSSSSKAAVVSHSVATVQPRTTRRRAAVGSESGPEAEVSGQQEQDDEATRAVAAAAAIEALTVVSSESSASKENLRPASPPGDGEKTRIVQSKSNRHRARRDVHAHTHAHAQARSRSPPQPKLRQSSPSLSQSRVLAPRPSQQPPRPVPAAFSSGSASSAGANPITPKRTQTNKPKILKTPGTPHSDRNIDTIVFGNTCFKAWYPSYYGKDVLGDAPTHVGGGNAKMGGGKRDPPMLDRLYICPCCFKYSKDMVPWRKHVRCCEAKAFVPGTKVYTHPRHSTSGTKLHTHTRLTSPSPAVMAKGKGKSRFDNSNQPADGPMLNEGEWSVWEVDGERDKLFCQNLSLFAKLFLDNKSVFFDVSGFNYFLLVYTPPPLPETHTASPMQTSEPLAKSDNSAPVSSSQQASAVASPPFHPRPQIVGFFSKEKMSWDNNNLACILVFPPWQRKGLGALLMGISYEISRREGILGGPEKPISELGRKGYKRFWAGEITRWILELELPSSSSSSSATESAQPVRHTKKEKEKDKVREQESVIVTVGQCSQATWIVPEDCLAVLRDMGVVEEDGLGLPGSETDVGRDGSAEANHTQGKAKEEKEQKTPLVPRVKIDKKAVRRWACRNNVELSRACDPDGFVEGYAVRRADEDDKGE